MMIIFYGYNRLGNKAFADKKFNDAIQHYTDAIKMDPSNHVYFSNRRYGASARSTPT
jgi:Tetratricopeptide repeat